LFLIFPRGGDPDWMKERECESLLFLPCIALHIPDSWSLRDLRVKEVNMFAQVCT
jgi:hypothetical protein